MLSGQVHLHSSPSLFMVYVPLFDCDFTVLRRGIYSFDLPALLGYCLSPFFGVVVSWVVIVVTLIVT